MTPIRRWVVAAISSGLVMLLLAACGSREESDPTRAPADAAAEARQGTVERSDDGAVRYSGKTEAGEQFMAQLGGDVEVPDDVTSQIPIYPDSVPFSSMETPGNIMITLDTGDTAEKVYDFYVEKLAADGWEVSDQVNPGGQRAVTGLRGDTKLVLQVDGKPDGSRISIVLVASG